ncbi:hypothetical protein FSP39_007779, partial [Pinctada imbricata]
RAIIERRFFVQKIFTRYGNGGKLTYNELEKLLDNLGLHKHSHSDEEDHDHHHDHPHDDGLDTHDNHLHHHETPGRERRSLKVDTHDKHLDHNECLDSDQLLNVYHIEKNKSVTESDFLNLCPSLIVMLDRGACQPHLEPLHTHSSHSIMDIPVEVWGYSCISVIVISLVGLLGVAVIPIMQQIFYHHLLQFLVALAVGALSGDAMLHLIPHALGEGHGHGHTHAKTADLAKEQKKVFKGLLGLGGVYFFFMVERIVTIVTDHKRRKKEKKHVRRKAQEASIIGELAMSKISLHSHLDHKDHDCSNSNLAVHPGFQALEHYVEEAQREHEEDLAIEEYKKEKIGKLDAEETKVMIKQGKGHGHSHGNGELPKGVASIAWMVILGDGIHNFTDGLAIGAAFTNSITGGISTSVAVFCHELPHEIGDFAVLLKAGMTVKQAITYNIVSSVLAFLGMLLGVMIGNQEEASLWIFIIVGGMFMYIALVDMLPEMMQVETRDGENPFYHLLFQTCGMFLGIGIMLLIALYENDIKEMLS